MSSPSSAGALNWGHCKLNSTIDANQVKHLSCRVNFVTLEGLLDNWLQKSSAKGMENDSDVALYRIHSSVVLARNMQGNLTEMETFRSKLRRKIWA